MMSTLDENLLTIIKLIQYDYRKNADPKKADERIEQIKQVFADEGYRVCTEVMGGVHGHILETDGVSHDIRPDVNKIMQNLVNLQANMKHDMLRLGLTSTPKSSRGE